MMEEEDQPYKVVFAGDPDTGKSTFVNQLIKKKDEEKEENKDNPNKKNKEWIRLKAHEFQMGKRKVQMSIWDLGGARRYRAKTRWVYHDAAAVFLVYDVNNRTSFKNVPGWLIDIRASKKFNATVMLVGNKNDGKTPRAVSTEEGQQFAADNNLLFFETSAINDSNVKKAHRRTMTVVVGHQNPFQIVLVNIQQAAQHNIQCVEMPLEENPVYVALSYRWGELHEATVDTYLGYAASIKGFQLDDFCNLCKVMAYDPDMKDIEYVWVDAICIDQTNYDRRKATIYHMNDIYSNAKYILAVPDLHLEHLKNMSAHNERLMNEMYDYDDYLYYLLQGNLKKLQELDETFLTEIGVPNNPEARRKLTDETIFFAKGFNSYFVHNRCYDSRQQLKQLCAFIQVFYSSERTTPDSTTQSSGHTTPDFQEREALYSLGDDNTLNEDPIRKIPLESYYKEEAWKQMQVVNKLSERRLWCELILVRSEKLKQAVDFLVGLIRDWSTRVWVISEYSIAERNKNLKYWFIQFPAKDHDRYNKFWEKVDRSSFSFYKFDFDRPAIDTGERQRLLNKTNGQLSCPLYQEFHKSMIKQLAQQTFLEMILKSKASRLEDRFNAVLPGTNYRDKLTDKNVVDSWKLKTEACVRLKLYEWISTKEKLDLLFISGRYDSISWYPVFPTFATSVIVWEQADRLYYPPMDKFQPLNFDINSNDTIKLSMPSDEGVDSYYLTVKPNHYYKLAHEYKNAYFDDHFPQHEKVQTHFGLAKHDDIDIIYIPPYNEEAIAETMVYVTLLWRLNGIFLVGNMAANKWELHKHRQTSPGSFDKKIWLHSPRQKYPDGFNIY